MLFMLCYVMFVVKWIRDAFPELSGEYTGFVDIIGDCRGLGPKTRRRKTLPILVVELYLPRHGK